MADPFTLQEANIDKIRVQFTVIYPHELSTTVISMKIDNFLDMFDLY